VPPVLAIVIGYLLGSLPTSALVARARGVDLRSRGSGNLGATNALRVLGPAAGISVLAVDVAKGAAAVLIAGALPGADAGLGPLGIRLAAGLAAVAGHIWPVFARFRGGKGVAAACGVFLAMSPLATLAAVAVFVVAVALTRYVSVGSMSAAVVLPFAIAAEAALKGGRTPTALIVTAAAVAVAVVARHASNIRRLAAGTESRFTFRREGGR
jgi:glycerol-3-phosphate acyltransferase PlsY